VELDELFFVVETPELCATEPLVTVLLIADDDPDWRTLVEDEEAPAPYEWTEETRALDERTEEAPALYEWAEEPPEPYEWIEDTGVLVCFDVIVDDTPLPTTLVEDETTEPLALEDEETPLPETFEDETVVLRTTPEETCVTEMRVLEGTDEVLETGTVPTVLTGTPDAAAARVGPRGKHLLIGVINASFW
jgi:hypothetical protein